MTPPTAEATALLALMLLHDSRRDAPSGRGRRIVVLLEDQDRRRWDHAQIARRRCRSSRRRCAAGPAVRAAGGDRGPALSGGAGRGHGLVADRSALRSSSSAMQPISDRRPRTARRAVAMVDGPALALALVDATRRRRRARPLSPLARRARRAVAPARRSCARRRRATRRALALVSNETERRFLERRLREVQPATR